MGMDSIMTVELRKRLETDLETELPATLAFEYPTIDRLTGFLASEVLHLATGSESAAAPGDGGPAESDDTVDQRLDEFSDAELAAILDDELASQFTTDEESAR